MPPSTAQAIKLLLQEYLGHAGDSRHDWGRREGDEADYWRSHWQRKINEIEQALRVLEQELTE